ncbi:MAG TPA: DUF2127 domain-containing protein [Thermoanaerobaculia bacterium]|jgi:uncharacterized membrane protein (DUF2068 family)
MDAPEPTAPTAPPARPPLTPGFIGIIVFKYLKASAFVLLGLVALRIARLPNHSEPLEVARFLGVTERSRVVQDVSKVVAALTSRQVRVIGAACFLIAGVFAAEGTLLAARVWWATYFTIVLTALGIPPEILEIAKRPGSVRRYLLLAVNVAILVYLWRRRNEFRTETSSRPP